MSNQYINFTYDPAQEGFDLDTWRLVYGDADIVGGQLQLTKAAIIHYGDILRGDAVFSINIAKPVLGDNSRFGFIQYNKNAYLLFQIVDGVLTAECSNGTTIASSAVIDWDDDWTDVDTEFRIKWEAGTATFFINKQFKAVFNDTYNLGVPVKLIPGSPMSLYATTDAPDLMLIDYIEVKGIQGFVMSEGNADSSFEMIVKESDKVRITENIVTAMVDDEADSQVQAVSISEAVVMNLPVNPISDVDAISISEDLVTSPVSDSEINTVDNLSMAEDLTYDPPFGD
jgi:hypothetical protein